LQSRRFSTALLCKDAWPVSEFCKAARDLAGTSDLSLIFNGLNVFERTGHMNMFVQGSFRLVISEGKGVPGAQFAR
jgi:hypothetical protein